MNALITAFILRDIVIEKTYRFNVLLKILNTLFLITIFLFVAKLIPDPAYFPFVFVGLIFSRFFQFFIGVFAENIRNEQYWGTAEFVFSSPHHPLMILGASAAGKFIFLLVEMLVYAMAGIILCHITFGVSLTHAIATLTLTILLMSTFGIVSASIIMSFKRGDPVNWLITISVDLLSGVYFPLSVMPSPLQKFAALLPTTHALSMWRSILLSQKLPTVYDYSILLGWNVILIPLSVGVFMHLYRRTARRGELGTY